MLRSLPGRRLACFAAAGAALALAACNRPPAPPAGAVESYAMRGEVVRMPAQATHEIVIRHEAVPDFRDDRGQVVGMEAMTMPFSLAPDLPASATEGLNNGLAEALCVLVVAESSTGVLARTASSEGACSAG